MNLFLLCMLGVKGDSEGSGISLRFGILYLNDDGITDKDKELIASLIDKGKRMVE